MSNDITERVRKIVADHLGVYELKLIDSASLFDALRADSPDTVELAMAFEDEFGCEIPDEVATKIVTVKDAPNLIQQNRLAEPLGRLHRIARMPACGRGC